MFPDCEIDALACYHMKFRLATMNQRQRVATAVKLGLNITNWPQTERRKPVKRQQKSPAREEVRRAYLLRTHFRWEVRSSW